MASGVPLTSNFSTTGIPSISVPGISVSTGAYAYPPGSEMSRFLDNLNQTTAAVASSPTGGSVIDWAQGLAAKAAQRKATGTTATGASTAMGGATATGGASSLTQVVQMLQAMMQQLAPLMAQLQGTKA